jgi:hypothetical protein
MIQYTSTVGQRLLRWYDMGITDPHDLIWLLDFYHVANMSNPNLVLAAVVAARNYRDRAL